MQVEQRGAVAIVRLCRAAKRNALSDALMASLAKCLAELPDATRAIVLHGAVVGGGLELACACPS